MKRTIPQLREMFPYLVFGEGSPPKNPGDPVQHWYSGDPENHILSQQYFESESVDSDTITLAHMQIVNKQAMIEQDIHGWYPHLWFFASLWTTELYISTRRTYMGIEMDGVAMTNVDLCDHKARKILAYLNETARCISTELDEERRPTHFWCEGPKRLTQISADAEDGAPICKVGQHVLLRSTDLKIN